MVELRTKVVKFVPVIESVMRGLGDRKRGDQRIEVVDIDFLEAIASQHPPYIEELEQRQKSSGVVLGSLNFRNVRLSASFNS